MKKIYALFILTALLFLLSITKTTKAAPPANFQTTQIIGSDIDVTTGFEFAPDGRIFILERTGTVKIFKNGQVLPTPFIQLNSVTTGDRGLTGIAFDPDFNNNHYVYFYFTGTDNLNRLVRVDATGDTASGSPVTIYKTNTQSLELHIGGTIRFGPDGKLYISIGDNGTGSNSQDLSTPFGKILRINKDGTVPADNPFVGQAGKLPEIWAYGLRNPYRFQFNPTSGKLYLGDVGNDSWEEINVITKGGNYGWPICEGTCANPEFINPIYAYPHSGQSSSVTGGFVYTGNMFPQEYKGRYFFGDYARGFIKNLTIEEHEDEVHFEGVNNFELSAGSAVDLKQAPDGSIYYITYFPARLFRISYSTTNQVPTAKSSAINTNGNPPLSVNFSSSGSTDPEGANLTYNWDFGDGTSSTQANPTKVYNNKGRFTVELTVSDGVNSAQATPIIIQVGTPPTVNITTPASGFTYRAGDTISFAGTGSDSNGQSLPDSAFTTEVLFHHDTHTHPAFGPVQTKSGQFTVPVIGEPDPDVFYEIKITGEDSDGLLTTTTVEINPVKTDVIFNTNPANLQILLDDIPTNTPLSTKQVVGFERNISTPLHQEINGNPYIFASWSDGGGINHTVKIPQNPITYTANYSPLPTFTGQYFNNRNLTGSPVLTRQDKKINFLWGESSPGAGVPVDNFSVRWTNTVFFSAGKYRFTTTTDDGVRLYIDNQLVIDKWVSQSSTAHVADVNLTTGNHTIRMEYFDGVYDAQAQLSWELLQGSGGTEPTPTPTPTNSPTPTPTNAPSPTPTQILTPTPTPIFSGFKGEYWNTPTAGTAPTFPTGTPNLTRDDASINFNWGTASPGTGINVDHFVTRWTKTQNFDAGTYRFTTTSDDGIRVYIDNELVINKWVDQSATTWTGDKTLTAGNHVIKVEYYENGYDAFARFSFAKIASTPTPTPSPSPTPTPTPSPTPTPTNSPTPTPTKSPTPTPTKTPTPTPSPTSTPSPTPGAQVNGLLGEYFDNMDLTNSKLKRVDGTINFTWGRLSPNSVIQPDTFSVRWTGQVQPQYSQTYTFYTATDDGVRLWVNNQLIIDKWVNQSSREWSGTIALTANQKYNIRLEYFENSVDAVSKLLWSSPSRSKQVIPQDRLFTTSP